METGAVAERATVSWYSKERKTVLLQKMGCENKPIKSHDEIQQLLKSRKKRIVHSVCTNVKAQVKRRNNLQPSI